MGLVLSFPGEVFGRIGHYESYAYSVLKDYGTWSVRRYAPAVAVETTGTGGGDDGSFMKLAKYIGVFSKPENTKRGAASSSAPTAIAMTTPVISESVAVAMTTPVISDPGAAMKFVLPSKYRSAADAPAPTDPNVRLVDVPERAMAAIRFSGRCKGCQDPVAIERHQELLRLMRELGLEPAGAWELHRFNPPFTLARFRTNEVLVPVAQDALTKLGLKMGE
mmetsp:Transcript_49936/g.143540  ORF Transcript_49936/g.143540 Transcript_49936/m.143540 type:complete len:221 (-) Transcript_49936:119-781(-)